MVRECKNKSTFRVQGVIWPFHYRNREMILSKRLEKSPRPFWLHLHPVLAAFWNVIDDHISKEMKSMLRDISNDKNFISFQTEEEGVEGRNIHHDFKGKNFNLTCISLGNKTWKENNICVQMFL